MTGVTSTLLAGAGGSGQQVNAPCETAETLAPGVMDELG